LEVSISGRHVAVTDAMREHARERVQRLERYSPHLTRARVTLSIEGDRHMAEIVASVKRRGRLVAKSETHDMYQSIDQAMVKVEKQLHKLEDRVKDRREGARQKRPAEPAAPEIEETYEEDERIEEEP